eukprot:6625018-Lingulodinium_polyedra.AAC.1
MKLKWRMQRQGHLLHNGRRGPRFVRGTCHVMVLHASLLLGPNLHDIVAAPAILKDTSTRCILNAILDRLPLRIEDCAIADGFLTLIVNSDSARACKLLGRALAAYYNESLNIRVLQTYCVMHLVVIAANQVLKPLGIINPLFCLANLLHDSKVMSQLLDEIDERVEKHLERTVRPRDPRHKEHALQVLDLLHWDDAMLAEQHADLRRQGMGKQARQRQLNEVAQLLPYDWAAPDLLHYCPVGCCSSRSESVGKVKEAFHLLFASAPPIPAPNKWLKMYPPISYLLVALLMHDVVR